MYSNHGNCKLIIFFFPLQEQDMLDQEMLKQYTQPRRKEEPHRGPSGRGFTVRDAPWDKTPDTNSTDDFPMIGAATAPAPNFAWGPARR
jgi:hypothetical protein